MVATALLMFERYLSRTRNCRCDPAMQPERLDGGHNLFEVREVEI
jgi:hypothetical protein